MRTITISSFLPIRNMGKLIKNLMMELMDSGLLLTAPLSAIEIFNAVFSWDTDIEHVTTMCDQLNANLDNLAFIMCTGDLGSFSIVSDSVDIALKDRLWSIDYVPFSENIKKHKRCRYLSVRHGILRNKTLCYITYEPFSLKIFQQIPAIQNQQNS